MNVTNHARLRFSERNANLADDIDQLILKKIKEGKQVFPREKTSLKKQYRRAIYMRNDDLVFVLSRSGIVITVLKYYNHLFK